MLLLYYSDIRSLDDDPSLYALSDYRREKLARLKPRLSRQQGIGAELLLNGALRQLFPETELPLTITASAYGKPVLPITGTFCSLAHSEHLAACAVADHELGLDIQVQRPCSAALVRRFFTPWEQEYISRSEDPDDAFTRIWTLKESWLKAIGTGMRTPLNEIEFSFEEKIRARGIDAAFWHCRVDRCHFALCAPGLDRLTPDVFQQKELP